MNPTNVIDLCEISRQMGRRSVLKAVSLTVYRGDVLGIVGPNGSGKTTLLRLIVGLIAPSAGTVTIQGLPVKRGLRSLRVAYFGGWATLPPMVTATAWAQLSGVRHRLDDARRRLGKLSPGMRQQAGLAMLERSDLDLVVLDEPWDSLDADASRHLTRLIADQRAAGATVVLTSHRLGEVAGACNRVGFLMGGTFHEPACEGGSPLSGEGVLSLYDRLKES